MSDYALGPHTASLGLAFSQGSGLPIDSGAARSSASTAREIENRVSANGDATGRPVGVAFDRRGALLVADDVGKTIWRVTTAGVK